MVTQSSNNIQGPSGFIELNGHTLVVDYGTIYMDGNAVGFLFEDGYLKSNKSGLSPKDRVKPIEEIQGCVFHGIDSHGMELELPGSGLGPSGTVTYNGVALNVIYGRIATEQHGLVGEIDDQGDIFIRDAKNKVARRKLDEQTQLTTIFEGTKSDGQPWSYEFVRPLYRKDKTYADNEIIRYFAEFDKLKTMQKRYVIETMSLWASCGILQVVRKSEGNCMLGNVKHGAAGVTGVRTGYVTLDREEFEKEISSFAKHGSLARFQTRVKDRVEVRVNLVVSHEFGHQLEFCLSQSTQNQVEELYEKLLKRCNHKHPLPPQYEGLSELLLREQVEQRCFISGYARSSKHEYWAECGAAFSVKESREYLKKLDPEVSEILRQVVLKPEDVLRRVSHDMILDLQSSLRVGGELSDTILD